MYNYVYNSWSHKNRERHSFPVHFYDVAIAMVTFFLSIF